MQSADPLFGLDAIVGQQSAIDVVAERFGFSRDQIARDPAPDRLKRHTGKSPGALVIGGIVDEEWLNRRKEHAGGGAHADFGRRLDPNGAAQLLQDEFVAGRLIAVRRGALELGDEHGARLGLQRL